MSTYRNAKRDSAVADEYLGNYKPCLYCGGQTEVETLINLGARCDPCFRAYCREGSTAGPMDAQARRALVGKLRGLVGDIAS